MKKLLIVFFSFYSFSTAVAQEDFFGDVSPGSESIVFPLFGELCLTIPIEKDKILCSNDEINKYTASIKMPDIVELEKIKATVVIYFDLDEMGQAYNISIKSSSGHTILDEAALAHFKEMPKWTPLTVNGAAQLSPNMNITYTFKPTKP